MTSQPRYNGAMPLPVLKASFAATSQDLVRFCHKLQLEFARPLAEEAQLDCGTALTNPSLARHLNANRMFDVAISPEIAPQSAFEEVQNHFAAKGAKCLGWVMNPSADARHTAPMIELLLAKGLRRRPHDILHLPRMPLAPLREVEVTIIPARASYRHVEMLAQAAGIERNSPQLADAALLHLDDPHYDAVLAMKDGVPIGFAGVLGAGEIGGVAEIYVAREFRRRGIGRTLMSRALEICARSLFRHVLLCVEADNLAGQGLFRQIGFQPAGEFVEYIAPPD